jgi:hypothetical protein
MLEDLGELGRSLTKVRRNYAVQLDAKQGQLYGKRERTRSHRLSNARFASEQELSRRREAFDE